MGVWDKVTRGTPSDPSTKGPQVRRCGAGETLRVWPLENYASWYLTHFLGQRTRPCLGDECLCHRLDTPVRTRWTGWILVAERFRPLVVRLLALTENCWDTCEQLRMPGFALRGRQLVLCRPKGGQRGRVNCWVEPDVQHHPDSLPVLPYTQKDQLMRVWFSEKDGYDEFNQYAHGAWAVPGPVVAAGQSEGNAP